MRPPGPDGRVARAAPGPGHLPQLRGPGVRKKAMAGASEVLAMEGAREGRVPRAEPLHARSMLSLVILNECEESNAKRACGTRFWQDVPGDTTAFASHGPRLGLDHRFA